MKPCIKCRTPFYEPNVVQSLLTHTKDQIMVAPNKMIALWNWDHTGNGEITELKIVDKDKQNQQTDHLTASYGASNEDWMGGNDVETPLGLFAHLATSYGFKDRDTMLDVLREFEKVNGQIWAKELRTRAGG